MLPVLLFDFDSTLVLDEGLDALHRRSVAGAPGGGERRRRFEALTDRGMAGELPFHEALAARMELLEADRAMVEEVARALSDRVTPSVARNRDFFRRYAGGIHVLSGGFLELILPTARFLGLSGNRVHAHRFRYDEEGRVIGVDPETPLARGGKPEALRRLGLAPEAIWMIGDGATDLELRELGLVSTFVAFVENRHRPTVASRADRVVASMEELLSLLPSTAAPPPGGAGS
jgi:D-3-phosphoglycerate dehydrogenase / 2-oxoglutarate reductase